MKKLDDKLNSWVEEGVISSWVDLGDRCLCYGLNGVPLRGLDIARIAVEDIYGQRKTVDTKNRRPK